MDTTSQTEVDLSPAFKANLRYASYEGETYGVYYSAQSESVVFPLAGAELTPEITKIIKSKLERRLKFEAKKK